MPLQGWAIAIPAVLVALTVIVGVRAKVLSDSALPESLMDQSRIDGASYVWNVDSLEVGAGVGTGFLYKAPLGVIDDLIATPPRLADCGQRLVVCEMVWSPPEGLIADNVDRVSPVHEWLCQSANDFDNADYLVTNRYFCVDKSHRLLYVKSFSI
jgi:hypothetical protein